MMDKERFVLSSANIYGIHWQIHLIKVYATPYGLMDIKKRENDGTEESK